MVLFALLALPAIAMNALVNELSSSSISGVVSPFVLYVLRVASYTVLLIDCVLFVVFLSSGAWRKLARVWGGSLAEGI